MIHGNPEASPLGKGLQGNVRIKYVNAYTLQHNACNATPRHAMQCNTMQCNGGLRCSGDYKSERYKAGISRVVFFKLAKFDINVLPVN